MKKYIIYILIGLSLIGCSSKDNGSGYGNNGGDITIIPPETPVLPKQSNLTITVQNAVNGAGVAGVEVAVDGSIISTGSATGKTDGSGKVTFSLDQSRFSDINRDGIADESKAITLHIGGATVLSRSIKTMVSNYGENFETIRVVDLSSSPSPEGLQVTSVTGIDLQSEPDTVINGTPVKIIKAKTDGLTIDTPKVSIPLNTIFLSKEGVELDTSSLNLDLVAFDVSSENAKALLSVGMSYEIANPSLLAADLAIGSDEAQNVSVALMGVVSVNISDAGDHQANAAIGDVPVTLTIPISEGMINPSTGKPVVAGDRLAVLSRSENENSWSYEGQHTVLADGAGNLHIEYEANHFSTFAVGDISPAQCTGTINIITQYSQPYSDVGYFTLQGEFINAQLTYNGEGRLSYENISDEPLKIIFTPNSGSSRILSEGTTVEGAIEAGKPIIANVSPCAAADKTIVFEALVSPQPTISISGYNVIDEGTDGVLRLTLKNPPVGKSVSFSLKSNTDLGDSLVIEEKRYVFNAGDTVLEIPFHAPENTKIEGRKNFIIEFNDADNRAVFDNYRRTDSKFLTTISVIDNDKLKVTDMEYTAVEEDENAVITFHLDQVVPEDFTNGLRMYVIAYSDDSSTATEMLDYDSKSIFREHYTGHGLYYVDFKKGEDSATLNIPLYNDNDVETNETFLITMHEGVYLYPLIDFDINATQEIRITDNDKVPDTNVTAYTVEFQRFGYADNRLDDNKSMWEGEKGWLKITLDKATRYPLTINYSAPSNPKYSLNGSGELVFDRGEATKFIEITSQNNDVTEDDVHFNVTLEANVSISGPASQEVTILDDDYDYIYIDGLPSGELSKTEGYVIQPEFFVFSNYSGLSIDSLVQGENKSVSDTLVYTVGGSSNLFGSPLTDVDDSIVNPPRTYISESTLSSDPLTAGSANFNVYIYGSTAGSCNLWNPDYAAFNQCKTFKQTISVIDNDKYLFAIEKAASVDMNIPVGSTQTEGFTMPLVLSSENLDRDVSFELQDDETLTLSKSTPRKAFSVHIPPIKIDPNLKIGDTGNVKFTVSITMTETSKKELQDAELPYKLDTTVVIDINYTIINGAITGAAGGS